MTRAAIGIFISFLLVQSTALGAEKIYRLGPDDLLSITVTGHPELSSEEIPVLRTNEIVHPVWGAVSIESASIPDIEQRIAEHLAAKYLKDPEVSVSLLQSNSLLVYLIANNGTTSAYRLSINGNLSELLIHAQVTPEICKRSMAVIMRRDERQVEVGEGLPPKTIEVPVETTVDLYELMVQGRKEIDVPLRRNDWVRLVNRNPKRNDTHIFLIGKTEAVCCPYEPTLTLAAAAQKLGFEDVPPASQSMHARANGIYMLGEWPARAGEICVFGAVESRGSIALEPGMSVGDALQLAKLSETAGSLAKVVLIRRDGQSIKKLDYYLMNDHPEKNYGLTDLLKSRDVLVIVGGGC